VYVGFGTDGQNLANAATHTAERPASEAVADLRSPMASNPYHL
jgi:hypothetical protein